MGLERKQHITKAKIIKQATKHETDGKAICMFNSSTSENCEHLNRVKKKGDQCEFRGSYHEQKYGCHHVY
jgi:hypothetical protein